MRMLKNLNFTTTRQNTNSLANTNTIVFSTSNLLQKIKTMKRDPFGDVKNCSKKSLTVSKKKSEEISIQSRPLLFVTVKV